MHYQMLHKFYGLILKNRKIYIGLLLFVCICILINLLEAKDCNYLSGKDYLEVLYFTGLVTVVVIEWQRALAETEKRKAEMEINKLYYAAYEELIALVRDRQHDLKNHINTIYSMIYTTHSYEELVDRQKEYCNFVLESGRETQILLRVDNPLLAGFFYQKEQEIRDQGLQIEYRLEYIAFPLAASEYEMIEMLGILVDNAVEALAASDLPDRKILIGYEREEQWDIFSVSNTSRAYTKEEIERFFQRNYSSKGKGRGIGLDKIRRKLRERDGGIKAENVTEQGQQYLRFSVMLPVKR
ncbi:MAG: GHKL domain-containing protein [Clostridiales bacterium]|nr:GHKL domain-containing protein [Clostridiales bacterium]